MEQFYILSLQKQGKDPELCFWREAAAGYTTNVLDAGKYSREEVIADKMHSSENSIALPVKSLPLITSKMKAFWESPARLVVHVIPVKGVKGHLVQQLAFGWVLIGKGPMADTWAAQPLVPKPIS